MWNIQLKAAGTNQWIDEMEQKITGIGDLLDVMEVEAEALKVIWESGAQKIWIKEYINRISEVKAQLTIISRSVSEVGRAGKNLADLEIKMAAEAKGL